jgi:16S rRNA C967 or C1407 C5-methylase (RsmB/RsmF family)/NOL1/NOP2/fmu family ribosome biogenesis protein
MCLSILRLFGPRWLPNFFIRVTDDQRFPATFGERMRHHLGEEWENFVAAHKQNSPVSIRVNPRKLYTINYQHRIPWTTSGYYLDDRPIFTLDPLLHAGGYYVQEPSSMFIEQAVLQATNRELGLNVLDLCAAPGGKCTHLLSLISKDSLLVSNEVIRSRVSVLEENVLKWGYPNSVVTNNDAKDFQRLGDFFDVILIDAPCSGEGLFRKDPQAVNEWSPDNVILCSSRQKRILKDIWPALKRDGILIYSTCTYNEHENEEVIQWLHESEDAESIRLTLDPRWGVEEISKNDTYGYRLFPHRVKGEGFFLSVMRKLSDGATRPKLRKTFASPARKVVDQLQEWLMLPQEKTFIFRKDELVQALPANKITDIELLANNLHLISSGTAMAAIKHDKLIPDHALALSVELNAKNFSTIDLDLQDALRFLRREAIEAKYTKKGFALVRFNDLALGWVNVLESRINNLYPAQWRIRMQDRKE